MQNPIEKLKTEISGMTNMQKKVADYIIKNPVDVAFMTLDQFANVIGTSTTTIMRLMYYINYTGYTEFQKGLQELLRNKVDPRVRLEANLKDVNESEIWMHCCEKQIENIKGTFSMISVENFDQVVNNIVSARKVYIIAARGGFMVAQYLYDFLSRMFGNCQLIRADMIADWCNLLPDINFSDLVIGISFPRYASRLLSFIQLAKEKEAKVISLTDSYSSPLAEFSDLILPCACGSLGFHNSPMSAMMVADCVINVASVRYSAKIKQRLDEANKIMIERDYYII